MGEIFFLSPQLLNEKEILDSRRGVTFAFFQKPGKVKVLHMPLPCDRGPEHRVWFS
jgi:hypothetical protein